MILALLACQHTPPQLTPRPFPRYTPAAEYAPDGPRPDVQTDPPRLCTTAEDWGRLKGRSQELEHHQLALAACYDGRELDRVLAQDAYARLHEAHRLAEAERRGLRVAVPVAGLVGGLLGAALAVGVSWAVRPVVAP